MVTAGSDAPIRDGGSGSPGVLGRLGGWLRDNLDEPRRVLALVFVAAFVARAAWLTEPPGTLIFDEAYYINAARVLIGWDVPAGANYAGAVAGLDPNIEHPPLGKVLIAASMAVAGDNGLGWRLPSLIAAMVALVALYRIVRATGESRWLGVLAVGLFAFDNLALVHGRIGTLDMLVLAAILLGAWASLRDRWLAAGALTGLGLLFKLTALSGVLALLILAALALVATWRRDHRLRPPDLKPVALLLIGFVIVAGGGLWVLDTLFTTFRNPLDHVRHMLEYGAALTRVGGVPSDCISNDSPPWLWLVNDCEMRYLRIAEDVSVEGELIASRASIDVRGAMNPVLLGGMLFAVPFVAWFARRRRSRLATWSLVWMGASYLPFVALALLGERVTYIYYFLPVVPALGAAIAVVLLRAGLPRIVLWSYVAAYLVGFAAYYPFRGIP